MPIRMSSVTAATATLILVVLVLSTSAPVINGGNISSGAEDDSNIYWKKEGTNICEICDCFHTESGTEIDCSSRNLTEIPGNVPDNTFALYLNMNEIKALEVPVVSKLQNLQYLDASFNKLEKLDENLFASNNILQVLDVSHNRIKTMPENIFSKTAKLEVIIVSKNRLQELPENLFVHTHELKELTLAKNHLQELPSNIFANNTELLYVDVSHNRINTMPENIFATTTNLEVMRMINNSLQLIPRNLFAQTPNLTLLNFSCNFIGELPPKLFANSININNIDFSDNFIETVERNFFAAAKNLKQVVLAKNRLGELHSRIFANNTELVYVDVSQNRIKTMPQNIFAKTTKLTSMLLQNNKLVHLPEGLLANVPHLKFLLLQNNRLVRLPEGLFKNTPNLEYLLLQDNMIVLLPEGFFANVPYLKNLFLQNNELVHLPEGLFANVPNLQALDLSENKLEKLPKNVFSNNNILQVINLQYNRLEYIPEIFSSSSKLKYLFLGGNNLDSVPKTLIETLPHLEYLDLADNRLMNISENTFTYSIKLENLYLDKNELISLPERLFEKCVKLRNLTLTQNKLRELPERLFTNTRNLAFINLSYNKLKYLPETIFFSTPKLRSLYLDTNDLTSIPERLLENTPNIETLYLGENDLTSIPERLLENTPNINTLILLKNHIQSIPEGFLTKTTRLQCLLLVDISIVELPVNMLKNVHDLEILNLSGNNITFLPEALFSDTNLIGLLDISDNKIEEIPRELFSFNNRSHNLIDLFLHKNLIKFLQSGLFRGLPNLKTVSLFENQIQVIESGVFSTTSVKVFLFSNKLHHFSYDSFIGDLKASEIHLYRNKITTISGNLTRRMPVSNILYIDCWDLEEVGRLNIQLDCVQETVTPEISLFSESEADFYLAGTLKLMGFICTHNSSTKYINCTLCPQGTYANWENECVLCPKGGFYLDDIGSTSDTPGKFLCKRCANGTYVTKDGGRSQKDCVECPDGTNKSISAGFRACFCKNGFARRGRFERCSRCIQPGLKCTEQEFQSLEPGYFWYWSFPNASIDEYNAFVKNLLNETRFYDTNTNYSKEIPRVHKCPRPASCINNYNEDKSVEGKCAVGYEGWVCSKCVPGYYLVFSRCLRCPDVKVLFFELGLLICVSTVVFYAIWRNSFHEKKVSSERTTADIVMSRAKITLGFYQVIGEYLSSLNYIKFGGAMQFIFEIISLVEMNVLKFFIRPQCFSKRLVINPKVEFIIAMATLFTFTTLPLMLYKILKVYFSTRCQGEKWNSRLTNLKAKTLSFVVGMIFITYPPVCFSVFQLFPGACKSFCLDLENKHCFTALRSDYDVRCDKEFIQYQVLAVMATVGYVVAFPLLLLHILRKYFSAPLLQEKKGRKNSTIERKITPPLTDDTGDFHLPRCLKFLCENYRPDYWYWEIVELARKVMQTALIIIFGWGNKLTVLLTIGISVVFLLLHARYRPMKSGREQRLQMFSLIAILTNVVFIAVKMPNKYEDVFSILLILLNISLIVVIFLEALYAVIIRFRVVLLQWSSLNLPRVSNGFTRRATARMEKAE